MAYRGRVLLSVFLLILSLGATSAWAGQTEESEPAGASVPIADFDLDGISDVVEVDGDHLALSLSDHPASVRLHLLPNTIAIAAHDLDADGDLDLISVATSGRFRTWRNDGHGGFHVLTTGPPVRHALGVTLTQSARLSLPSSEPPAITPQDSTAGHADVVNGATATDLAPPRCLGATRSSPLASACLRSSIARGPPRSFFLS